MIEAWLSVRLDRLRRAFWLAYATIEALRDDGRISERQYKAGNDLRERFLSLQKSPPAIKEIQVDCQPDFGAIQARAVDAASKFHAAARYVPVGLGPIVDAVVLQDLPITGNHGAGRAGGVEKDVRLTKLRAALDGLADGLGY